jgi:hypothetical protein
MKDIFNKQDTNKRLYDAVSQSRSNTAEDAALVFRTLASFDDFAGIDPEMIVHAAECGASYALGALMAFVPLTDATRDHYDRALVAAAVHDAGPSERYAEATRLLLKAGANPEAFNGACRYLAASSVRKDAVYRLLDEETNRREQARARLEKTAAGASPAP